MVATGGASVAKVLQWMLLVLQPMGFKHLGGPEAKLSILLTDLQQWVWFVRIDAHHHTIAE